MPSLYRFPTFEVLVTERQIRATDGRPLPIGSRAFDLLLALIEQRGRTVSKKELLATAWKGLVVENNNVQVQVSLLRTHLGAEVIATAPGQGYRLAIDPISEEAPLQRMSVIDSPDRRRIAVLPFRSTDSSPEAQILAKGVALDLINELSRNSDLRVISHQSSFTFAGGSIPLVEIGARLRSRYLVDGTIDCEKDYFRIHLELLDAVDDRVLWTFQETMPVSALADIRDRLVRKIGGFIHTRSQHMEARRIVSGSSAPLDAYAQIWKACGLLTQFRAPATKEARSLLEQAVQTHPGHSAGWAWLGCLNALDAIMRITGEWHPGRSPEYMGQITKALSLDPENATACRALSIAYRAERNFEAALAAGYRGVEVAPSNAHCLLALAEAQCAAGDTRAALGTAEDALDLHPYPPAWVYTIYSCSLWAEGRLHDALAAADNGLAELPHYWPARLIRLYALYELEERKRAREEALIILHEVPRLSTTALVNYWADTAQHVRTRVFKAGAAAGIPQGRSASLYSVNIRKF
jgi:TolB-like protein/tetratricopeptide (TPR) repeat protein